MTAVVDTPDIPIDTEQLRARLRAVLPDLDYAYLFGSAATGHLRPDSDVDIAVDVGRKLNADDIGRASAPLERLVGRPVDLVDLRRAGPILAMQVLRTGQLLVESNRRARLEFEMYTPSRYADFKRMRRPIDDALVERLSS
ncbi:MAG: nucleotidyltransferase domain-containing protein [Bradymonadaceae bacterium]